MSSSADAFLPSSSSTLQSVKVKIFYSFTTFPYTFHQSSPAEPSTNPTINCLVRLPDTHNITVFTTSTHSIIGIIDLHTCLNVVVSASPELLALPSLDYTVYAHDHSEVTAPLVGNGLLSHLIATSVSQTPLPITGQVHSSPLGQTLHVNLKFLAIPKICSASKNQHLNSIPSPFSLIKSANASKVPNPDPLNICQSSSLPSPPLLSFSPVKRISAIDSDSLHDILTSELPTPSTPTTSSQPLPNSCPTSPTLHDTGPSHSYSKSTQHPVTSASTSPTTVYSHIGKSFTLQPSPRNQHSFYSSYLNPTKSQLGRLPFHNSYDSDYTSHPKSDSDIIRTRKLFSIHPSPSIYHSPYSYVSPSQSDDPKLAESTSTNDSNSHLRPTSPVSDIPSSPPEYTHCRSIDPLAHSSTSQQRPNLQCATASSSNTSRKRYNGNDECPLTLGKGTFPLSLDNQSSPRMTGKNHVCPSPPPVSSVAMRPLPQNLKCTSKKPNHQTSLPPCLSEPFSDQLNIPRRSSGTSTKSNDPTATAASKTEFVPVMFEHNDKLLPPCNSNGESVQRFSSCAPSETTTNGKGSAELVFHFETVGMVNISKRKRKRSLSAKVDKKFNRQGKHHRKSIKRAAFRTLERSPSSEIPQILIPPSIISTNPSVSEYPGQETRCNENLTVVKFESEAISQVGKPKTTCETRPTPSDESCMNCGVNDTIRYWIIMDNSKLHEFGTENEVQSEERGHDSTGGLLCIANNRTTGETGRHILRKSVAIKAFSGFSAGKISRVNLCGSCGDWFVEKGQEEIWPANATSRVENISRPVPEFGQSDNEQHTEIGNGDGQTKLWSGHESACNHLAVKREAWKGQIRAKVTGVDNATESLSAVNGVKFKRNSKTTSEDETKSSQAERNISPLGVIDKSVVNARSMSNSCGIPHGEEDVCWNKENDKCSKCEHNSYNCEHECGLASTKETCVLLSAPQDNKGKMTTGRSERPMGPGSDGMYIMKQVYDGGITDPITLNLGNTISGPMLSANTLTGSNAGPDGGSEVSIMMTGINEDSAFDFFALEVLTLPTDVLTVPMNPDTLFDSFINPEFVGTLDQQRNNQSTQLELSPSTTLASLDMMPTDMLDQTNLHVPLRH